MADLDLTEFLKEGSGTGPAKLDWLDVNESDYRQLDQLPKQNLDVVPDLKALWRHEDEPATKFVPNTGGPKTMGDMGDAHGPIRLTGPENILRTARLAIMQSPDDPRRISHALTSRFDRASLAQARTALAGALAERGLLGRYYIDAADFPSCAGGSKKASEFVRRFAPESRFVKAKEACANCIHRSSSTGHCGVFHKEIVMEVPYTDELAEAVEKSQRAKGKAVQASADQDAKDRIRAAFLARGDGAASNFSGRHQPKQARVKMASSEGALIAVSNLTKKRDEEAAKKLAASKARPIVAMLRREMLKGRSLAELVKSLRLAFDKADLASTRAHWEPLFKQAGLYGTVYTTQDSFEDCREGAAFLSKHGSQTKALVMGDKCGSCIFNKVGRCMMYGKKLVKQADDILTPETVTQVIWEQKLAGNLPVTADKIQWGDTPAEALRMIYRTASSPRYVPQQTSLREAVERGFYGQNRPDVTTELTKRAVVKATRQFLNEGLYGTDLKIALQGKFEVRDIVAAKAELAPVLKEQGLQGIRYIDPTPYDDYGKGCKQAAARHRSRAAVQFIKAGDKCASCIFQTTPGHCSVVNKRLVREVPYVDKAAEQKAILSSGRATEVSYANLMNNGLSMMAEYELQQGSGDIELTADTSPVEINIEFGNQEIPL